MSGTAGLQCADSVLLPESFCFFQPLELLALIGPQLHLVEAAHRPALFRREREGNPRLSHSLFIGPGNPHL